MEQWQIFHFRERFVGIGVARSPFDARPLADVGARSYNAVQDERMGLYVRVSQYNRLSDSYTGLDSRIRAYADVGTQLSGQQKFRINARARVRVALRAYRKTCSLVPQKSGVQRPLDEYIRLL